MRRRRDESRDMGSEGFEVSGSGCPVPGGMRLVQ